VQSSERPPISLGAVMLYLLARLLMRDVQPASFYHSSPKGLLVFEKSGGKQARDKKETIGASERTKRRNPRRNPYAGCVTVEDVLAVLHEIANAGAYGTREQATVVMTAISTVLFKVSSQGDCRRVPSDYGYDSSKELTFELLLPLLLGDVPPPTALLECLGRLHDALRAEGDAKKELALSLARELPEDPHCPARLAAERKRWIQDEPFRTLPLGFSSHYLFYCLNANFRFRSPATGILMVLLKVLPSLLNDANGRWDIPLIGPPLRWSIGLDLEQLGLDLEQVEANEQRRRAVDDLRQRLLQRNSNAFGAALCRAWGAGYLDSVSQEAEAGLLACPLHILKKS